MSAIAGCASCPASTGTRRVARTEYSGAITALADNFNGARLNSPNDIVCRSNGAIWSTDPSESRAMPHWLIWAYDVDAESPLSSKRIAVDASSTEREHGRRSDD